MIVSLDDVSLACPLAEFEAEGADGLLPLPKHTLAKARRGTRKSCGYLQATTAAARRSKNDPKANAVAQFEILCIHTLTFEIAHVISQYEGHLAPQREATDEFDDEPVRPLTSTISPPCPPRSISALLDKTDTVWRSVTVPIASINTTEHDMILAIKFVFELIGKETEAFIPATTPISLAGIGNINEFCGHSIDIVNLALTSPRFSTITLKNEDDDPATRVKVFER